MRIRQELRMNVLGINFNHDGAAVLMRDGNIVGYANTERFSRLKKHPGVRQCDLENVLEQAGIPIGRVDLVLLLNLNNMDSPDIPRMHGSHLKQTWPSFWLDGTFTRVKLLEHSLPCALLSDHMHHAMHAAATYYFSPFESGVAFACDPIGAEAYPAIETMLALKLDAVVFPGFVVRPRPLN
jgi:carbamoyltransferase